MSERETYNEQQRGTFASAGTRGGDDRRGSVKPAEQPAPVSPAPDPDAVRKGEEILDRVKPY